MVAEPSGSLNVARINGSFAFSRQMNLTTGHWTVYCTGIFLANVDQPANAAFSVGVDWGAVLVEYSDLCGVLRDDIC